jgi:hypothetical protein
MAGTTEQDNITRRDGKENDKGMEGRGKQSEEDRTETNQKREIEGGLDEKIQEEVHTQTAGDNMPR